MPPSSLYCCQRSVSRISAAARNLRIAASPLLSLLDVGFLASAVAADSKEARPAPTPTATPLATSERRLMPCCDSSVGPAGVPAAYMPEACLAEVDMMYLSRGGVAMKSCYSPMTPVAGVPSGKLGNPHRQTSDRYGDHSQQTANRQRSIELVHGPCVHRRDRSRRLALPAARAYRVHFTPGARTGWHKHPNGQV